MDDTTVAEKRVYLRELAVIVDRAQHTIRQWSLPDHLEAHRDDRGWRYWTPVQVKGIKKWMLENDMRPGRGLNGFSPSPERVKEMLSKLREPRGPRSVEDRDRSRGD